METLLWKLVATKVGRKAGPEGKVRQRDRKGGHAARASDLIQDLLNCVNSAANLSGASAVTLETCLRYSDEGRNIQQQMGQVRLAETVFKNVKTLWNVLDPGARKAALGYLSMNVAPKIAQDLFSVSRTALNDAKAASALSVMTDKAPVTFNKPAGVPGRSRLPLEEVEITKKWFYENNPTRSGDVLLIAWMVEEKVDFYFMK